MGDIFDRPVHPLYSVMAFTAALIVAIIIFASYQSSSRKNGNHKMMFFWVLFFCLQDGVWGLFASHIFYSDAGLMVVSCIFHLSAILSAFVWTYYFLSRVKDYVKSGRAYLVIAGIIAAVQVVMVIVNLSSHFMFYVDADGWYQTTDARSIMFYLQFATYIVIGIVSLVATFRSTSREERSSVGAVFAVNLAPILFGIFQMLYPDAPADSIGFAVGCVIIELFLTLDYKKQVVTLEELQSDLNDALAAAERANEAKTTFLFSMSHDIRTPLNAITGFTKMAKTHINDTEKTEEYLDKIDIAGDQLLSLINQVLEMSRIESGKVELNEVPINVYARTDGIRTIYEEQAAAKDIRFTAEVRNVEHPNVIADTDRIRQIVTNIIGNALKYTPAGGTVEYTVEEDPYESEISTDYVFTVKDTGIGMSEEFLTHIFDEFARENTSTVSKIQGTGLGMSIVKELVSLLGGTIDIQSKKGRGTTMTVRIPVTIDPVDHTAEAAAAGAAEVSLEGLKILLVEDNEMNREIAEDILSEFGVILSTAEDGDVAVDLVSRAAPGDIDVVLMDVQMPRMNGYDATRAIRALPDPALANLPIIAMTANAFEEDRQNALAAGMNEHLAKPIDIEKLKAALGRFAAE